MSHAAGSELRFVEEALRIAASAHRAGRGVSEDDLYLAALRACDSRKDRRRMEKERRHWQQRQRKVVA